MYGDETLEPRISAISNGRLGDCFYCINPNNFHTDVYPRLLEVKARGIQVVCVGGDIGVRVSEFEYITQDEIYFLASGVSSGSSVNKVLLFTHNVTQELLIWKYVEVDDL